jgi:hypothetical protein
MPVTVAMPSKAVIVSSNLIQGMDIWYVYAFILCLCRPVQRPCDGLTTRPGSPTVCEKMIMGLNKRPGP